MILINCYYTLWNQNLQT